MELKGIANAIVFCLDSIGQIRVLTIQIFGRSRSLKFQNLLEVHKCHENHSVGQFLGENEIHELFSLLTP